MNAPKIYCGTNTQQVRDVIDFIESQKGRLKSSNGELVLDVGCGPGDITNKIFRTYFPPETMIVGTDASKEMVEYANTVFADERMTFKEMDIGSYIWDSWEKGVFDKIFSFYCLHWVKDCRQAASNIFQLLKPGGHVFIMFCVDNGLMTLFNLVASRKEWECYTKGLQHFHEGSTFFANTEKEYYSVLEEAGFRNIHIQTISKEFYWPSLDILLVTLEGVDPYRKYIPETVLPIYKTQLKDLLLDEGLVKVDTESGWITLHHRLAYVYATK